MMEASKALCLLAKRGFGWRVPRDLQATSISLDSGQPHSGSKNLRIEFSGNSNPNVSQLILLEPSRRYRINFASRSQDVVTGGLPLLVVSDAAGDSKRLGQSAPLPKGTSDWQSYSFEFTTTPATTAVVLSLQRESCTTSPCPIFGSISLDSFSVEQLKWRRARQHGGPRTLRNNVYRTNMPESRLPRLKATSSLMSEGGPPRLGGRLLAKVLWRADRYSLKRPRRARFCSSTSSQ